MQLRSFKAGPHLKPSTGRSTPKAHEKGEAMRRNKIHAADYDYLIIGAGPAGLQMGYYLQQSKKKYLILEKGEGPGTFFKRFPRHGTLISSNKVYTGYDDHEINLRFDWNSL